MKGMCLRIAHNLAICYSYHAVPLLSRWLISESYVQIQVVPLGGAIFRSAPFR